jgi:hypothetical protein
MGLKHWLVAVAAFWIGHLAGMATLAILVALGRSRDE